MPRNWRLAKTPRSYPRVGWASAKPANSRLRTIAQLESCQMWRHKNIEKMQRFRLPAKGLLPQRRAGEMNPHYSGVTNQSWNLTESVGNMPW
ncbi:MAG: hypothetical protein C5B50_27005 [Verrucomicrobia bacterium]|nr:MAG: hypothetical protein C5B50_27005 [Verrucomicrobiota bacterium]